MLVSRFVVGTFVFFLFFIFYFLLLRFHILRPGISHIVSIYPLLPYLGFDLLCSPSLPLCTRRFVSFALHLFVHNVRSRFSSRVTRWFHPWAVVTPSSSRYCVSLVLSYPGTVMSDCASHTCSWCIFFSFHPNALSFVLLSITFSSFLSLPLFIFS